MKTVQNNAWQTKGWEEHGVLRREIAATMSFAERLQWLEAATASGRRLQAAPVVPAPAYARPRSS